MTIVHARLARRLAALALCVLPAFPLSSCRLMERGSVARLDLPEARANGDLVVAARFARRGEDVPGFFLKAMPDSGVFAVHVLIRNDGAGPLVIHSANGIKTGPGFEGFALSLNGGTYLPIHPKEVVSKLVGPGKAGRYRRHGVFGFVTASFVAPIAVYFIYNEVDIGRFYRPLFNRSFCPAREDGMFEAVRIGPGRERSGYLYFALPRGAPKELCELVVHAASPVETGYSLKGSDFRFSRDEFPLATGGPASAEPEALAHNPSSCDAPYGFIFALAKGAGGQGLYFSRVRSLNPASDTLWTLATPVKAPSATIADASCIGSLAACAVNFKSKSAVYLMQCAEKPDVFAESHFSRGVRRVFLHTGGAFVVTDDGICHPYDGSSHKWGRGIRLGVDVEDTGLVGGTLMAFQENKTLNVFGASGKAALALLERHTMQHRTTEIVGLLDGDLVLLERGSAIRGDMIAVFDIGLRAVKFRSALPGKVNAAASDGSSLLVQFDEGTLERIVRGRLGTLDVKEVGYLPFEARTLKSAPHGFLAVAANGAFAVGPIDSVIPGSLGAVEVSVTIH